jgi:hypothetical protein
MTTRLEKYSPEYLKEQEKLIALLQASLANPRNLELQNAVIDSLEKLGFVKNIAEESPSAIL